MPTTKPKSNRRRRRGNGFFPPSGGSSSSANAVVPTRMSCPRRPPEISVAPPFRRTVRVPFGVPGSGTTTLNVSQFVAQDKANYGMAATDPNRWQAMNIIAGRIYMATTGTQPTNMFIAVESLTNSAQTNQVFQDQSTIAGWSTFAWKWPKTVQQNNLAIGSTNALVVVNNSAQNDANGFMDLDIVFTG